MSEGTSPPPATFQENRLHPLAWVFESVRNLRGAVTAFVFIVLFQQGGSGYRIFFTFLAPFFFVTGVLGPLLRYATFRYRLEPEELVIRKGVLSRNERRLAYSRIQNIDLVENPFHRAFGLALVRLETASGGRPEATMHLSSEAIAELRRQVFDPRSRGGEESQDTLALGAEAGSDASREVLLELGTAEVVRLGLIQNRGMVLVAAAFGLFFQQSFIDWDTIGQWISRVVRGSSMPSVEASPALLIAGSFLILLTWIALLAVLSVTFALVRFHGFELTRDGEDLRARFGLLTRVAMTVPRGRIQRVWSRQTLLHRLFDRLSIRLDTAGGSGDGATGRHWLAPVARPGDLRHLVLEALPDLDEQPLLHPPGDAQSRWQPVEHRAWKRLYRRWLAVSLLPILGLAWLNPWALVLVLPSALLLHRAARRSIEHRHFAVTDDAILSWSGWLSRTLSVVRFEKIQAVSFRQSPFDRRHGMGSVHIDTAGASLGQAVDLDFLDEGLAQRLAQALHAEAAQRSFRWS